MKEFGDAIYLRTCDDLLTLEMIQTAAPAVDRYSTEAQALAGHDQMVAKVRQAGRPGDT